MAAPRKFVSVKQLQDKIDKYFKEYLPNNPDEIPDIESLCDELDCDRDTLNEYQKLGEFSVTIKRAKNKIFRIKKQMAMKGKIPPAIFIFDAKNNHDYVEKIETDNKHDTTLQIVMDDQLKDWAK